MRGAGGSPSDRTVESAGHRPYGEAARIFAFVLLAYAAGAWLAWQSFGASFGPAFFYPSAGVTAAALILTRRALWPAVVAAIVLGESLLNLYFWNALTLTVSYTLANVVEPMVGAALVLAWCGGQVDLSRRRDFFIFVAGGCVLGPAVGGLIGGTATAVLLDNDWLLSVLKWWVGDALGVLVIATPILLWQKQSHIIKERPFETGAALVFTAAFIVFALEARITPTIFVLPILALVALRQGMLGASLTGAVFAFTTNAMTSRGKDIFGAADVSAAHTVAVTQLYVAVTVIIGLLFAQEVAARSQAVREHDLERRERLRLEGLSRLAQRLSAAMDIDDIGRALADHTLNDAGARAVNMGLLNPKGTRLEWVVMAGYPPEVVAEFGADVRVAHPMVATDAARTGEPVLVRTAREYLERYPENSRLLTLAKSQSLVGWPLIGEGKPIGALVMTWSEPQPLDRAQLAYISAVAAMTGQAVMRARVYADDRARAAVLRSALLPGDLDDVDGLDFHVSYEPADLSRGLGSDWYDVMTLPGGRTYFAVGDVMGRGLTSVEDMGQLRSAARALALQGLAPSRVLDQLSGLIRDAGHSDEVTMAVAVYDAGTGTVSFGTAGHPPAVLRKAATAETLELSDALGPALGLDSVVVHVDGNVAVDRGDILVMYTDGLTPAGTTELQSAIAGWDGDRTLQDVCEELHTTLAPRPREDDVCVLAVRFGARVAH